MLSLHAIDRVATKQRGRDDAPGLTGAKITAVRRNEEGAKKSCGSL